jgi:septum site-determining protein MinD
MLAVAGGKGGCGKTTTTLGLAAALVRQRKSAVAVDADREMPNLHTLAGVRREPSLDAVADGWPPEFVAGTADAPALGVSVIPAASGPQSADSVPRNSVDSPRSGREPVVQSEPPSPTPSHSGPNEAFHRVRDWADAVLLDCPAGAGPDAAAPLRIADAAAVVTTAEPACLRDAAKTAAMARELGTPVVGAVVSRAQTESDTEPVSEGVADLLDCQVLGVIPDVMASTGSTGAMGTRSSTGTMDAMGEIGATSGDANPSADPLAADRVRAAHDRILSALQPKCL